ncbi:hypothetical protein L7F22_050847 [Adiantum nelumboides]|nr:hypothetical protein [Adiantum nelumboides]
MELNLSRTTEAMSSSFPRWPKSTLSGLQQMNMSHFYVRQRALSREGVITCQLAAPSAGAVTTEKATSAQKFAGHELFGVPCRGSPLPFGATLINEGVNFAIHSSAATSVTLCLFTLSDLQQGQATREVSLHPRLNRTGDVWHIYLPDVVEGLVYGYRIDGPFAPDKGHRFNPEIVLIDPYAKAIVSREAYGVPGANGNCWPQMGGMVPFDAEPFDWEGDVRPHLKQKDLVVYEIHVRGFTQHKSSNVKHPGTYDGLVEKLNHLKELGINAIELMPCNEFNELEYYAYNSVMGDYKMNFWGYSTINFFSPMIRYAKSGNQRCGLDAINEFKILVKEAHKCGIEVFMDVVFNHTAEGNEMGPTISFRGVDNAVFYMLAPEGEFYNYSGCGNTFNCNNPIVRRFIVECLR